MRWFSSIFSKHGIAAALFTAAALTPIAGAEAAPRKEFSVCWSIYAGWIPWEYAEASGIMKKWADRYGLEIDVVQINDYAESLNQYAAGQFDGCSMTSMDALTVPAAGGVDTTALIIGDFSNGGDGVVMKGTGRTVADLRGQTVNLVELSVSHYLLVRALESQGMTERDVNIVNTSDADLVAAFQTPDVQVVATWNPLLSEVKAVPNVTEVFHSGDIPGEVIDLMVVSTKALNANPDFGKALVGAWYDVMAVMGADTPEGEAAREHMARVGGTTREIYETQLQRTKLFFDAKDAVAFAHSKRLPETMKRVAAFSFDHGLLGAGAQSADFVGMSFAGGITVGDTKNIKLRFDPSFMELAAKGALLAAPAAE